MANNFRWRDRQARMVPSGGSPTNIEDYVAGGGKFQPSQRGALSSIGMALSGIAAPFLGDYDWAQKQAQIDAANQQAELEFQKYLMENSIKQSELGIKAKDSKFNNMLIMGMIKANPELAKMFGLEDSISPSPVVPTLPQRDLVSSLFPLTMGNTQPPQTAITPPPLPPSESPLGDYNFSLSGGKVSLRPTSYTKAQREDQWLHTQFQKMGDDLDWNKNVRSAYGVTAQGFHRAERLEGLVNQYKDLNIDRRETEELAIGLNSLLQGSNVSAQEQVRGLIPKSAQGSVQKLTEWLVNEPQGLNQQKFVNRMLTDVRREKKVMEKQLMRDATQKLSKYDALRKKDPERWANIVQSWGIDPVKYDAWKKGGYKSIETTGLDEGDLKGASTEELLKKLGM